MNYKKKIQEIELEINMINKYYINQVKDPNDNSREDILSNYIIILNPISSFHTLPNIPLKTKLKMKNLIQLFLAILYYLTVFSFIIVILSIGYQFLK